MKTIFQIKCPLALLVFLFWTLAPIYAIDTSETRTVNVATAGKLSTVLSKEERQYVVNLTITGKLNGTDFNILRTMATDQKLQVLDLSGVNIVSGGESYYSNYGTDHYTKNNEFGYSLFIGCKQIQKVVLPNSLVTIGQCAFWNCTSLKTIVIGSKVTTIKPGLWGGCRQLTDVQINNNSNYHLTNGILYNKDYSTIIAALQTWSYGDLTIRSGVKEIQYDAFAFCSELTSVSFPSSVTTIGDTAFEYTGITSVNFTSSITSIGSFAFSGCKSLKQLDLTPLKVTSLDYGTFMTSGIEVVYLPKTLKELKQAVFSGTPLKHIFAYTATPATMYDMASSSPTFKNVDVNNCIIHVPQGRVNTYKAAAGWKEFQYITDSQEIEASTDEAYAIYTSDSTLTFYCDKKRSLRQGKTYGMNTGDNKPEWEGYVSAKIVVFDPSFSKARPTSTYRWFLGNNLTEIIGIENLNTSEVTNMSTMFWGCWDLTSLDVSHFNTGKVTDMSGMFAGCHRLKTLDVSHFDTSNVTSFTNMFSYCISLISLNVTHFDTSKATNMSYMFQDCSALTSLDVSGFDTKNVTNMAYMFNCCSDLTSLNVSHFDTRKVTDMTAIFAGCRSLRSLDVTHFDTNKITNMGLMFSGCSSLTDLDVTHFDTSNVTDMGNMFQDCSALTSLDLSNFDTSNVTNMSDMFSECTSLANLNLSSFDTSKVMIMFKMFWGCTNLTTIYCGDNWNTENVTNSYFMFSNCSNLIGCRGTIYDKNHTDASYAHIDGGPSAPGYFTALGDWDIDICDVDDLLLAISELGENGKGTEVNPAQLEPCDEGMTIDEDVDIDDLYIDLVGEKPEGSNSTMTFSGNTINIKNGGCVLIRFFCLKSDGNGGGITNSGSLTFTDCVMEQGDYVVQNLEGGTMMLKGSTTVGSGIIENSGSLYVDGTVLAVALTNKPGGCIYITDALTNDMTVTIESPDDVEPGTYIIFGGNGYTLTADDLERLDIVLPSGYEWYYDEAQNAIVVNVVDNINELFNRKHSNEIYDLLGRKSTVHHKGVSIRRMDNSTVKKVIK